MKTLGILYIFLLVAMCGCSNKRKNEKGETIMSAKGMPDFNSNTGKFIDSEKNFRIVKYDVMRDIQKEINNEKIPAGGIHSWNEYWNDYFERYKIYRENPNRIINWIKKTRRAKGLPEIRYK